MRQRSIRLNTLWLPGAVTSFHRGICCSNCCTVALAAVVLFVAIALLVIEMIKGVNDTTARVCLQVQIDHRSADVAMAQQFFYGMKVGAGTRAGV